MSDGKSMTREEKLAFAEKIVSVLRVLNRPPRRIRTDSGWTDNHAIIKARARVELGVEFGLPGAPWRIYDEQHRAIATKFIRTCRQCCEPFVVSNQRAGRKMFHDAKCKRAWERANVNRDSERERQARARRLNPERERARNRRYYAGRGSTQRRDRIARGMCGECGQPSAAIRCVKCGELAADRRRRYRQRQSQHRDSG